MHEWESGGELRKARVCDLTEVEDAMRCRVQSRAPAHERPSHSLLHCWLPCISATLMHHFTLALNLHPSPSIVHRVQLLHYIVSVTSKLLPIKVLLAHTIARQGPLLIAHHASIWTFHVATKPASTVTAVPAHQDILPWSAGDKQRCRNAP